MKVSTNWQLDKIQNNPEEEAQACLWRIILIGLIEVESPPTMGSTHPLVGILEYINRKRNVISSEQKKSFIALWLWITDAYESCLRLPYFEFSIMKEYTLDGEIK